MSVDNALFVVVAVVALYLTDFAYTSESCVTSTACTCILPNGYGYDLTNLVGTKDFLQSRKVHNRTFFFHPCKDAPLAQAGSSDCGSGHEVSLCLQNENKAYENFGLASETKITFEGAGLQLNIQHDFKNGTTVLTTINLACRTFPNMPDIFEEVPSSTAAHYSLLLFSSHACQVEMHSSGLSTGSVLVIVFFIFCGIYFVGGALSLKLLRGATGWEMLPNQEFWFDLPKLIRKYEKIFPYYWLLSGKQLELKKILRQNSS